MISVPGKRMRQNQNDSATAGTGISGAASHRATDALTLLTKIIQSQFNCPDTPIAPDTVADDVDGWDSLGYAALIVRIEQELSVDLGKRAMSLANVGELVACIDRARRRQRRGAAATRNEVYRSATCSVIRSGSGGPAAVFFSGLGNRFALTPLLEFERIIQECGCGDMQRYFITDFVSDFYQTCSEEIVAFLSEKVSDAKTFVGNSMGGYAALRFAEQIADVKRVFAIVPQIAPPGRMLKREAPPPRLFDRTEYLIVYGDQADAGAADYYRSQVKYPKRQRIVIIPDTDHFLVARLRDWGLLGPVLRAVFASPTWLDDIEQIIADHARSAALTVSTDALRP